MKRFAHGLIVHTPNREQLSHLSALADGMGDEGVNWRVLNVGGNRHAFAFRRPGLAKLFRVAVDRRGLAID